MYRRVVSLLLTAVFIFSSSVFAYSDEMEKTSELKPKSVEINGESQPEERDDPILTIDGKDVGFTGETISLPKTKSGSILENKTGVISGVLNAENTWDFYLFYSETSFFSVSKLVSSNTNYIMTLGVVDNDTNTIMLTDYITAPNQSFMANFGNQNVYAWVIQSSDGSVGQGYSLQYNMSYANNSSIIKVSDDLQKIYAVVGGKLRFNNVLQSTDYKYDIQWDINVSGENRWQELHITMYNANVEVVHVGGVKYKEGLTNPSYPNAILFKLLPGGDFYHYYSQNPPYINLGTKDIAGINTPRTITLSDINDYGPHYLIYDINADKVVEFATAFTKPWSTIGDKSNLQVY